MTTFMRLWLGPDPTGRVGESMCVECVYVQILHQTGVDIYSQVPDSSIWIYRDGDDNHSLPCPLPNLL